MGFKLDLSTSITYPVKFPVVTGTGIVNEHTIKFDFLRIKRENLDDYMPLPLEKVDNPDWDGTSNTPKTIDMKINAIEGLDRDVDWLMKFTQGWHDVDIAGSTEFNRENFRTLLSSVPNLANLIYQKFLEASTGGASKN